MSEQRDEVRGVLRRAAAGRLAARAAGAAVVLAAAALVPTPAPATASATAAASAAARTEAACTDGDGVTVVVDFGPYGGVQTGCAPRDVGSGLDALDAAGFGWEGTQQFWDVVCRIAGLPTPDDDQCVRTPPGDAYWSYWHAPRGGSWTYSTLGASAFDPPAGSVEGWAFGSGELPAVAPPDVIAEPPPPPPPPPPTSTAPPEASSEPGQPAPTQAPPQGESPTATAPPTSSTPTASSPPVTTASTASATASRTTGATRSSAGGVVAEPDPAEGSSPVGAAIGLGAAGLIAAVAGVVALRRRRTDETG